MRTCLFTLVILLLVGGAIWYKFFGGNDSGILGKGEIAPFAEWAIIFPGKWDYEWKWKTEKNGEWEFKGNIEFFPDGKFERRVKIKHEYHKDWDDIFEDHTDLLTGGNMSGTWETDPSKGLWFEVIKVCDIADPSIASRSEFYHYNGCEEQFKSDKKQYFGNYNEGDIEMAVYKFTKDKIVIKAECYSDDSKRTFIFTRKK